MTGNVKNLQKNTNFNQNSVFSNLKNSSTLCYYGETNHYKQCDFARTVQGQLKLGILQFIATLDIII